MSTLLQYVFTGVSQGMVFGLVGLGFIIIYRVSGVLNFAQGSLVAFGGLLAAVLVRDVGMPLVGALVLVLGATALLGMGIGGVAVVVRRAGEMPPVVATVGLALMLEGVCLALFGDEPLSYSAPVGNRAFFVAGAAVLPEQVLMVAVGLVAFAACQWLLGKTITGMALRASAGNAEAARLFGIDPRRMALLAFALAGALGGLVGMLVVPLAPLDFGSDVTWTVNGFSAAIIGGLDDPLRAAGGGLALGLVESLLGGYVASSYETAGALLVMLIVLLWRPEGLFTRHAAAGDR